MGDITRNLSRREFACHCDCGLAEPHPILCCRSQLMFDLAGCIKVDVRSGSRCEIHNAKVSRASKSSHLVSRGGYSLAADYAPLDSTSLMRLVESALEIREFNMGGIGIYVLRGSLSFIHVDIRSGPARWGVVFGDKVNFGEALGALQLDEKERGPS